MSRSVLCSASDRSPVGVMEKRITGGAGAGAGRAASHVIATAIIVTAAAALIAIAGGTPRRCEDAASRSGTDAARDMMYAATAMSAIRSRRSLLRHQIGREN